MTAHPFVDIAELSGSPRDAFVYEHGWQSWSPAGLYPADGTGPKPQREIWQTMAFRPEKPPPQHGFQSEGLLGVLNHEGFHVWTLPLIDDHVPSIRARSEGERLVISADGPTDHALFGMDVPTFGLVAVDRTTQERTPKPSAEWLGSIARTGSIVA